MSLICHSLKNQIAISSSFFKLNQCHVHLRQNLTASFLYCFWTFWVHSLTMCSHAQRRPLTCKAVEKQKRVPNAIKNSSRLVTGAAASQIIHFLLAGLTLAACSKDLLIKSCGGLSHGGWRTRYHCYRESAAQDGPNDQLSSSFKGQLISKCPFGVFKFPKKPTKFFPRFLP